MATRQRRRADHSGPLCGRLARPMEWVQAQLEQMKAEIAAFLHEHLALTLSTEKTQITHRSRLHVPGLHVASRAQAARRKAERLCSAEPSELCGIGEGQADRGDGKAHLTEVFRQYNRVTRGWAMHFRFGNSKAQFARLAYHNWWTFYRALRKRHGKRSKAWVLEHYTHRVPSATGTRTTFGIRVGDELVTMYHLAGVQVQRLPHATPNPQPVSDRVVTTLETPPQLYPAWNGEETRPGQSRFARIVRQRDKVCQRCGKARAEEAHHLQRWSQHLTMDPACGVGLCKRCHIASHHG